MYTGDGTTAFDETAEVRPKNPYAATKATVDQLIAGECGAADTLGAATLRYFNAARAVLTADGVHLGERHEPESHLIPILLQAADGQRDTFTLFGTDYETLLGDSPYHCGGPDISSSWTVGWVLGLVT